MRTSNDDPILYDLDGKQYKDRHTILEDCGSKRVLNGCIRFYCCENAVVEGVTMRDSSTFAFIPAACNNVVADNVKTIGMWRYNSDGIDLFNCSNVIIRNCFLRDFDDCIVIKGIKGWDYKNNENILVENCTVWCDWGRALEYGAETNAPEYRNIIMRNCDIIHGSAVNIDIQHHNNAEIHNCLFDDIRVEYSKYQLPEELDESDETVYTGRENTRQPALIGIPIVNSGLFSKENIHGCVHDMVFRNISVTADKEVVLPRSFFYGIDGEHTVTGITLENITFNGENVTGLDEGNISANEYSRNIVIR